jgi:hypothetical protein
VCVCVCACVLVRDLVHAFEFTGPRACVRLAPCARALIYACLSACARVCELGTVYARACSTNQFFFSEIALFFRSRTTFFRTRKTSNFFQIASNFFQIYPFYSSLFYGAVSESARLCPSRRRSP